MLRIAIAFVVALFGLPGAHAQTSRIDRIEIFDAGLYQGGEITKKIDDPSHAIGFHTQSKGDKFVRQTTDVPAQVGVSFGFRYRIVGSRRGDPVSLTRITRFPAEGLRNPARNGTYYRNEILSHWKIGDEAGATFTFDAPWEAVPGTWVIELWQGDRKLAEQSFNVHRP